MVDMRARRGVGIVGVGGRSVVGTRVVVGRRFGCTRGWAGLRTFGGGASEWHRRRGEMWWP